MKHFTLHTATNTEPPVSVMLAGLEDKLGFIPNIFAAISESAPALTAFMEINAQFSFSSFDAQEQQIILLATSVENQCTYCVAGHTAFSKMLGIADSVPNAIRHNHPIEDAHLEALNQFTRTTVRNRGHVSEEALATFLAAGFTAENVLDVVLGVAVKTMSNLTNNIINLPLDKTFQAFAWQPKGLDKAANKTRP